MADDGIVVYVGDEGGTNASANASANAPSEAGPTNDSDTSVQGLNEPNESLSEQLKKLEDSLTKGMKEIVDAINGKPSEDDKNIKKVSEDMVNDLSNGQSDVIGGQNNKDSTNFIKANKLTGLKPQDINIIDRQFTLGALLVHSKLLDIEELLKKAIKNIDNGGKGKKEDSKKEDSMSPKAMAKAGKDLLGTLTQALTVLPPILVKASKDMAKVKWTSFLIAAKLLPIFTKAIFKVAEDFSEHKKELKDFEKGAENLKKAIGHLIIASLLATVGMPFFITGTVGVLALTLFALASNLLFKVMPGLVSVIKGTLVAVLMVPFFAAMWLNTFMVSNIAKNSDIKTILKGLAIVGIVAGLSAVAFAILGIPIVAGFVALGSAVAILMAVGLAALGLITDKIIAPLSVYDPKAIANGMKSLLIVAGFSALVFGILALASLVVIPGTIAITFMSLGFISLYVAFKLLIKAGKLADDAFNALGYIDKGVINGQDPAGKNDSKGILGFISKFGSKTLMTLFALALIPSALLGLVAALIFVSGFLLEKGIKAFDNIGKNYFPAGTPMEKTGPIRGILGIVHFIDILDNGIPGTDGKGKIGLSTLIAVAPLALLGFLLKFAADKLNEGLTAIQAIVIDKDKIINVTKDLHEAIKSIHDNLLVPDEDSKKNSGVLGWLLKVVLGSEAAEAYDILVSMLPLLTLGVYGLVLSKISEPLANGLKDFGRINNNLGTLNKFIGSGTGKDNSGLSVLRKLVTGLSDMINKTGADDLKKDNAEAIKTLFESFVLIIPSILSLANQKEGDLLNGIKNISLLLNALFGSSETKEGVIWDTTVYTPGAFTSAINNMAKSKIEKVNNGLFSQIKTLIENVKPIGDLVIGLGSLDSDKLTAGMNAITTLIDKLSEMMNGLVAKGDEGWIQTFRTLLIDNANGKNLAQNPLFEIIKLLNDPDFNASNAASKIDDLSKSMSGIKTFLDNFNQLNGSKFSSFMSSVSMFSTTGATTSLEKFANLNPQLSKVAITLHDIANSLESISINSGKLGDIDLSATVSAQSTVVSEKAATANNDQIKSFEESIQEYLKNISDVVIAWSQNGVNIANNEKRDIYEHPVDDHPDISVAEDIL